MKIAFISDFSKTLTASGNPTTWSVFAKSGLLWEWYTEKRNELFHKFHKYELAWDIEQTKLWWKWHLDLFVEYELDQEIIQKVISDEKYFKPREWLDLFFWYLKSSDIGVKIITSSWVSNFIKEFFSFHDIDSSNIQIIGNSLNLNLQWKVTWYKNDIICSLNKYDHEVDLSLYDHVVLLWDDESDICMYQWDNCTRIWFCDDSRKGYDIYLWKEWRMDKVIDIIKELEWSK